MTPDQIAALAREYAEEMIKGKPSEELPNCLKNSMLTMNTEYVAEIFRWLLRRYCLVEKSKVEQMYKEAAEGNCKLEKMRPQNTYAKNSIAMRIGVNFGCVHTLKSLFPEIAKEVQSREPKIGFP